MWARVIRMVDRNFAEADDEQEDDDEDIDQYDEEPWNQRLYRTTLQTQGLRISLQGVSRSTAWFGDTPFEHPFSHNTPSG